MKILYNLYTNKGKVRQNNEDGILAMDELYLEENFDSYKEAIIDTN